MCCGVSHDLHDALLALCITTSTMIHVSRWRSAVHRTVTDVGLEPLGIIIAIVASVSSSLSQISCGLLQKRHGATASELLGASSGVQAMMLVIAGPYMDFLLTRGAWIYNYEWSIAAFGAVALSCGLAVLVNISQYMVLGRFSAVTYSVSSQPMCSHRPDPKRA